jgi:lipoprotein-releasing system permease protein
MMEASKGTSPFAPFEWMIALRYLRARRKASFVSVIAFFSFLGIALGVATLIVVMSVMNGFHKELLDKIVGINGHIFLQAADTQFTDYDEVVKDVAAVPGVELVIPLIESPAAASTATMAFALVRGIREADIKRLPGIARNVKQGTLDGFDTAGGVAIGQRLAENLGLRIGDKLKILIANGAQTPFGIVPRSKVYPVAAIFQIGMAELDNLFVYMALPEAQGFFNKDDQASVIEIFVANPASRIRPSIHPTMPRAENRILCHQLRCVRAGSLKKSVSSLLISIPSGYDGLARVQAKANDIKKRFGVDVHADMTF